jgi:hypothetical protein
MDDKYKKRETFGIVYSSIGRRVAPEVEPAFRRAAGIRRSGARSGAQGKKRSLPLPIEIFQ